MEELLLVKLVIQQGYIKSQLKFP